MRGLLSVYLCILETIDDCRNLNVLLFSFVNAIGPKCAATEINVTDVVKKIC